MANPDTAAQGLDRLRAGVQARGRRARGGDLADVSRAFVADLGRIGERHSWAVLFFDTWEQIGRYLDEWLRDLLDESFGPVPVNLMLVLAGRDELAEREWEALRPHVVDVPLEVFTATETRELLAARGVTEPGAVEAVLDLSMGLPLLVQLLALSRAGAAEDVGADGDVVDAAVARFVQWIDDPGQRETVLACALAPQLNEDVFTAAVPQRTPELWGWLCGQPFVSGRGAFKQYHAVVRASMVRQQRARSPQSWTAAHLRLADAHAEWRAAAERGLAEDRRWGDARWRRHRLDETYHRLCATPAAHVPAALEEAVHAAGQATAVLRQWTDALDGAARDTADPDLLLWAERLQTAVADDEPAQAFLAAIVAHGRLDAPARAWAHTYRGRHLYFADRDEEAVAELSRAIAVDPGNARAWAHRGDAHRWLGHREEAVADLTESIRLDPSDAVAFARRGEAHREAGRYEEAVADFTAALDLDPAYAWALGSRGQAHREAGRHGLAVADLTAALALEPQLLWALGARGQAHRDAGQYDLAVADFTAVVTLDAGQAWAFAERGESHQWAGHDALAVADFTAALAIDPTYAGAIGSRGQTHRKAGRFEEAIADLTAALELEPAYAWALAERGEAHREAGRYEEAVADLTAALELEPAYAWALSHRGEAHREAGRFEEAVADFTAALAVEPVDAWVLGSRGQAHRKAGHYELAVADFTAALDADPAYAWAYGARGEAHREAGRYEEAVADFTAALGIDPGYAWALAHRGEAHSQARRYASALADLTAVLELSPGYGWALAQRGEAHRLSGDFGAAVADFTAALDADPDHTWARRQRGVAARQSGDHATARADFDRILDGAPGDLGTLFERALLETVEAGPEASVQRWRALTATPTGVPVEDAYLALFRALLLDEEDTVEETTEALRPHAVDDESALDLLETLAELAEVGGEVAARAGRCRRLVLRWRPE